MRFNGWQVAVAMLAVAALGVTAKQAEANQIFVLQGVTFADGGTLAGSFVTDDTRTSLISANISASANGSFTAFNYAVPDGTPSYSNSNTFLRIDSAANQL